MFNNHRILVRTHEESVMMRTFLSVLVVLSVYTPIVSADVVQIETSQVSEDLISKTETFIGRIVATKLATVATEVNARVVDRLVEPGVRVEGGQVLIRLNPEKFEIEVNRAKAALKSASIASEHAAYEYARANKLLERKVISIDELRDFRTTAMAALADVDAASALLTEAQRTLRDTEVKAPFAGQVEEVSAQVGDYMSVGQTVARISNFGQVRIRTGVTGTQIANLKVNDIAVATLSELGGRSVSAKITSIGRLRDPVNGHFTVEFTSINPSDIGLKEGLLVHLALTPRYSDNLTPTIPIDALVQKNGSQYVYVISNDVAYLTPVVIGRSDGRFTEVVSGLSPGDLVATEGRYALGDRTPVQQVIQ